MLRRAVFLWPDANTLRRRADRIESAILMGLLAVLLLAAPAAAFAAGSTADHAAQGAVRAEQSWHQVTATLASHGPEQMESSPSGLTLLSVPARWTAAGRAHAGWIPVDPTAPRSTTAELWVDAAGLPTGPPGARSSLPLVVGLAALGGAALAGSLVLLAASLARLALNRQRMTGWETAWRAVGPEWSRQL
jgi:hypothetical protein